VAPATVGTTGARCRVDLNADLGESYGRWRLGDDEALVPAITSANVACGFHAGDPSTIRRTCELAVAHGVAIGAQVAYPDLVGFGRRFVDVEPGELRDAVLYQIGALDGIARTCGGRVTHVKPHGALYNAVVHHRAQADAVVDAVATWARHHDGPTSGFPVLGLPGSTLLRLASDAGLRPVPEAFADRGYLPDGTLVPRDQPGALVDDPDEVVERVVGMVVRGRVGAVDGTEVDVDVASVCVHGDTPGAATLARAIRAALAAAGVDVLSAVA